MSSGGQGLRPRGVGLGKEGDVVSGQSRVFRMSPVARALHIGQRGCRRRRWPTEGTRSPDRSLTYGNGSLELTLQRDGAIMARPGRSTPLHGWRVGAQANAAVRGCLKDSPPAQRGDMGSDAACPRRAPVALNRMVRLSSLDPTARSEPPVPRVRHAAPLAARFEAEMTHHHRTKASRPRPSPYPG